MNIQSIIYLLSISEVIQYRKCRKERKTECSFSLPLSNFCSQFVWDVQSDVTGKASRMASVFAVDKYKTAEAPQWISDRRREHYRAE